MLRAKNLHETLRLALGGGVESVVLATTAGGLLAAANVNEEFPRTKEHSLMVAIVVNVWRNYSVNDLTGPSTSNATSTERKPENLEFLVIDVGAKRLCMLGVGGGAALLCLTAADGNVEPGMLRLRAASLHAVLDPQLRNVLGGGAALPGPSAEGTVTTGVM
jgi:hypothetical protein